MSVETSRLTVLRDSDGVGVDYELMFPVKTVRRPYVDEGGIGSVDYRWDGVELDVRGFPVFRSGMVPPWRQRIRAITSRLMDRHALWCESVKVWGADVCDCGLDPPKAHPHERTGDEPV